MTTFFLIRHASMDGLGHRIVGREPGVHLNEQGRAEAEKLAARLAQIPCAAIYSSPMERAQDTARSIARVLGLEVSTEAGLNEIDYGEWTGKTFDELDGLPEWRRYNTRRQAAQISGGESMAQLVPRAGQTVERLRKSHVSGVVILVSHADWIRAAAAHYASASLDSLQKFEVCPASISILRVSDSEGRVIRWNDTGPALPVQ
jgi:probable phosphoglycerate mutase